MNRDSMLARIGALAEPFDVIVIGGGATGAGVALDAASRKLRVLLLEKHDFGTGTSSRSTKIIHGGVRYLAQGRIGLVREALRERSLLLHNAPHLVRPLAFTVPVENMFEQAKYFVGLKLYDFLAGKRRVQKCRWIPKNDLSTTLPGVRVDGFRGAIRYYDAQFDDARLLINLIETAHAEGACVLNYAEVVGLNKDQRGRLRTVTFHDHETGQTSEIEARAVVNATGACSDQILALDEPQHAPTIAPSQGTHIVVDRAFLPNNDALLMPRTPDGRIMFAIPWQGHVLLGTTDTPLEKAIVEPTPMANEIDMILHVSEKFLTRAPVREDILSTFAGIRPLVRPPARAHTSEVSREHQIDVLKSGLVNISGGKWTTYRLMATQCVDTLLAAHKIDAPHSRTHELKLHSHPTAGKTADRFQEYGIHADDLGSLCAQDATLRQPICEGLSYTKAHCVWAIRHEMARTVEDILARRTRALFLNARAARAAAPAVSDLLVNELRIAPDVARRQLSSFEQLTKKYLP